MKQDMNRTKWMIALALVVVVAWVVLMIAKRQAPPPPSAPQTKAEPVIPEATTPSPSAIPGEPTPAPEAVSAPAPEPAPAAPEPLEYTQPIRETKVLQEGGEPREIVRVKPEQVLATVNGAPVTLKNLVAVPDVQRGAEHTISASLYDALLERAVVREVALQAAKAKGIELTPEQKAQLEKIKSEMLSASPDVVDMTMPPERIAFEQRDTEGRMLLVNLVAQAGAPGAFVTPEQVKAYYEAHKGEYGELPSDPQEAEWAWQRIDREIRNALAEDTANAYQQAYDQVVGDLKSAALIEVTPTVAP
jgi:hypothetical protein